MERRVASVVVVLSLAAAPASAQSAGACADGGYPLDLAVRRGGGTAERVRGPAELELLNLNRVRYDITIGQEVTFADGPNLLAAGLIPEIAAAVPDVEPAEDATEETAANFAEALEAPAGSRERAARLAAAEALACPPETGNLDERVEAIQTCLSVQAGFVKNLVAQAEKARNRLNARKKTVDDLIARSDQVLLAQNGAQVLADASGAQADDIGTDLDEAEREWPASGAVAARRAKIEELRKALDAMTYDPDWSRWIYDGTGNRPNSVVHAKLQEDGSKLIESLAVLADGSDLEKAYQTLGKALGSARALFAELRDKAAFQTCIPVRCGFPFFEEKRFDYTITRVDRTITDPAKATSTEKLVQVVCPSHFTVSGGIAVSGITERDYDFEQSLPDPSMENGPGNGEGEGNSEGGEEPGLVGRIGLDNSSSEQINPAVLISTRLTDWGVEKAWALHLSAGSMADFDNPEGGLRFGYLLGLSFSFKDQFLLTAGVAGSRVPTLAGGFSEGDIQPQGLTEVPVTREWQFDWVLGVTYGLGGGG